VSFGFEPSALSGPGQTSELVTAFGGGLEISYETVRRWVRKFGPTFARNLRRLCSQPMDAWHLDEMVVSIQASATQQRTRPTREPFSRQCRLSLSAVIAKRHGALLPLLETIQPFASCWSFPPPDPAERWREGRVPIRGDAWRKICDGRTSGALGEGRCCRAPIEDRTNGARPRSGEVLARNAEFHIE
jgi:hypothetical protein